MSFWRLYYHIVWGTRNRHPTLEGDVADIADRSIRRSCHDMGLILYALGMMPEHVHLVAGIPPRYAVAQVVKQIKGSSSHFLNQTKGEQAWFGWQNEYGVMSFGERSLRKIINYAENQRTHHLTADLMPALEQMESEDPRVETRG